MKFVIDSVSLRKENNYLLQIDKYQVIQL